MDSKGRPAHGPNLQAFLEFVLSKYVEDGVGELDTGKLSSLVELKYRPMEDAVNECGDRRSIRHAFVGFQQHLYNLTDASS